MYPKGLIGLIWLFLSIYPRHVLAQEKIVQPFFELGLPDDFPNRFTNSIVRDNNGLLWIGTNKGLCRYISENEVKVYNSQNTPALKSNLIEVLLTDSRGNIWMGTRHGGITRYNPRDNRWDTYVHNPSDSSSLSHDDVLSLLEDQTGRIWIGTEQGLNLFQHDTGSFIRFGHNPDDSTSLSASAVIDIYEDHAGRIWLGTWSGGISLMVPNKDHIQHSSFKRVSLINQDGNSESVWKIYQDSENRYWVCSHFSGLYLMQLPVGISIDPEKLSWKPRFHNYSHHPDDIHSLSSNIHLADMGQDANGHIWIGTSYGLSEIPVDQLPDTSRFNTPTLEKPSIKFRQHFHDPFNIKSIKSNKITTILEDEQDLIWIGTDQGVTQYNWFARQIQSYQIHHESSQKIYVSDIFIPSKDHAIIGYYTGEVMDYNLESGENKPIHEVYDFVEPINDALNFFQLDHNTLYITRKSGISKIDFHQQSTSQLSIPIPILNHLKDYRPKSVHISTPDGSKEKIWIGSEHGLHLVYADGKQFETFFKGEAPTSISDNSVTGIAEDSFGRIWVTTHTGLNLVKEEGDSIYFEHFLHDSQDTFSLPDNRLLSISSLNDHLILGSRGGLIGYDYGVKEFYPIGNHRFFHPIISLISPNDSNIWAGTGDMILNYHVPSRKIFEYGDMEISFHEGSIFIDRFDRVFIGGFRGFVGFAPKNIIKNEQAPVMTITEVRTLSPEREEMEEIMMKDSISLAYDTYQLSIAFSSSNFNQPEDNQFAYRMIGFDDNWVYTSSDQPIVYTNLQHGSYQFQVKGCNNDGLWNEVPQVLHIEVEPAFWETPLFQFLVGILSMLLIYLFTYLYTKSIRKQNQKLISEISKRKEIEKELMFTNSQLEKSNKELEQFAFIASHDLKEPLHTIDSFSSLLTRQEFQDRLGERGAKYVAFISQGSVRMKEIIQSLLSYCTTRQEELQVEVCEYDELVQATLGDLSEFIKKNNAQVKVAPLPSGFCDPVQIRMVFSNLIINGIKFNHQEVPKLHIWSESLSSGELRFAVKDNGIGIKEEFHEKIFGIFKRLHLRETFPGTGIGLALCAKIIERHQGKIWLESQYGSGSTFWFQVGKLSHSSPLKEEQMESISIT